MSFFARYQRSSATPVKVLASGLLLLVAALYVLARSGLVAGPVWGYVAAFSEAAMVGAIADWFAVTALFRRPLGLPIPHTAIIPRNKARIGQKLSDFIVTHFLSTEQVVARLQGLDVAGAAAGWLRQPEHAEVLARQLTGVARFGVKALRDEQVQRFFQTALVGRLRTLDLAPLLGQAVDVLLREGRHQAVLDELLVRLQQALDQEGAKELVARAIASEIKALSYLGLDDIVGSWSAKKVVQGIARLIAEVAEDPEHPLRRRLDAEGQRFAEKLKQDPQYGLEVGKLYGQLVDHPATLAYLGGLWRDMVVWLQQDLERPDSRVQQRMVEVLVGLGQALAADPAMAQWINQRLLEATPQLVVRYRGQVGDYIARRVEGWETHELVAQLEHSVGRDIQFIRINGTLVGGLVGVALHALGQWLG